MIIEFTFLMKLAVHFINKREFNFSKNSTIITLPIWVSSFFHLNFLIFTLFCYLISISLLQCCNRSSLYKWIRWFCTKSTFSASFFPAEMILSFIGTLKQYAWQRLVMFYQSHKCNRNTNLNTLEYPTQQLMLMYTLEHKAREYSHVWHSLQASKLQW